MQDPSATYNENTIKSLTEKYPNINWSLYLKERFDTYDIDDAVNDDSLIIIDAPQYFEGLNNILDEADSEAIVAYSEW